MVIFVYKVGATGRTECDGLPELIGMSTTLGRVFGSSNSGSAERRFTRISQ